MRFLRLYFQVTNDLKNLNAIKKCLRKIIISCVAGCFHCFVFCCCCCVVVQVDKNMWKTQLRGSASTTATPWNCSFHLYYQKYNMLTQQNKSDLLWGDCEVLCYFEEHLTIESVFCLIQFHLCRWYRPLAWRHHHRLQQAQRHPSVVERRGERIEGCQVAFESEAAMSPRNKPSWRHLS